MSMVTVVPTTERLKKARRIAKDFCCRCTKDMTADEKECKNCWVYALMNSILEGADIEVEENEKREEEKD